VLGFLGTAMHAPQRGVSAFQDRRLGDGSYQGLVGRVRPLRHVVAPGLVGVRDGGVDRILHYGGDLLARYFARQQAGEEVAGTRLAKVLHQEAHGQQFGTDFDRAFSGAADQRLAWRGSA
jgi:hypothetical protein